MLFRSHVHPRGYPSRRPLFRGPAPTFSPRDYGDGAQRSSETACMREAGLRRRRHAVPVAIVHVLALLASPPLPISLCFSFPPTVHGALTLRGAMERPEAARDIEGSPLGVCSQWSRTRHQGSLGVRPQRGVLSPPLGACTGQGAASSRCRCCCEEQEPASPSPGGSASRRPSRSAASAALGHLRRRRSSHHHGGAGCAVLAALPRKVGELLASCTTASPAGRPISSRRSTTSTVGACDRCLCPRVSCQYPTRHRTPTLAACFVASLNVLREHARRCRPSVGVPLACGHAATIFVHRPWNMEPQINSAATLV